MAEALLKLSRKLESFCVAVGRMASWAIIALMLVIVADVILRRYFVIGSTRLQELEWHFHGILLLLTFAFAYMRGAHVRIELLRDKWSTRRKLWIEFLGILFLLLPFAGAVVWFGWDYAGLSWAYRESSPTQTGLPARYIIKGALMAGFGLLMLSALAILMRTGLALWGPAPVSTQARKALHDNLEDHPETA